MTTTVDRSWCLVQFLGDALKLLPKGAVLDYIECHNNAIVQRGPSHGPSSTVLGAREVYICTLEDTSCLGGIHRRVYKVFAGPTLVLYDEVKL